MAHEERNGRIYQSRRYAYRVGTDQWPRLLRRGVNTREFRRVQRDGERRGKKSYYLDTRSRKGNLQASRLGILAPEVLGRADSSHSLREMRRRAGAGKGLAGEIARGEFIPTDRHRALAACEYCEMGQRPLSEVQGSGYARDQHDATVGGFFVVLPALHGPEQQKSARR